MQTINRSIALPGRLGGADLAPFCQNSLGGFGKKSIAHRKKDLHRHQRLGGRLKSGLKSDQRLQTVRASGGLGYRKNRALVVAGALSW